MQTAYPGPGPPVDQWCAPPSMDPGGMVPRDYGAAEAMAPPVYGPDMGTTPPPISALEDIGPFSKPILNRLVRLLSALTSLITLILHFAILGQGVTTAMRPVRTPKNASLDEQIEEEGRPTPSSGRRTSSTSTRFPTITRSTRRTTSTEEELLGRALPTTNTVQTSFDRSLPTAAPARIAKTNMLHIRQNRGDADGEPTRTSTKPPTFTYVPNTDIPARDGAIGFTASSHLLAAFVILLLLWLEWLLFTRKPTLFSYWGPLLIAGVQLFMAFDILGRSIPVAAQAGGYVLLLLAVVNMFLAGWTVLQARKRNAPPPLDRAMAPQADPMYGGPYAHDQSPYPQGPEPNARLPTPMQEGALPDVDPNAMPYMGEKQGLEHCEQDGNPAPLSPENQGAHEQAYAESTLSSHRRKPHRRSRRASTGTLYDIDVDSYYSGSLTLRGRRHSYAGQGNPDYAIPPPAQPIDDIPATSPISLYGPEEYRRRLEQQRRTRRRSLVQPAMQFDSHTGTYLEPAGRFVQRSSQMLPDLEEEEDEEAIRGVSMKPDDPSLRQDGFANRTRVWKRLQSSNAIL